MPNSTVRYNQSDLPKCNSELGDKIATYIYEWYRYARNARLDLENVIWPACDDAYHCIGDLPTNKAMKFVDQGDIRESDLKTLVDVMSDNLLLAIMGRDDTWFQPIAYKSEEQYIQNMVRDYMASRHRKARTRNNYGQHLGQTLRRGTSAIGVEWKKDIRMVRLGAAETVALAPQVAQEAAAQGLDITPGDIEKALRRQRQEVVDFSGPVVRPLDMYDVILDPVVDLRRIEDSPMATLVYKTPEELNNAEKEDGTKFYSNLDGLYEWAPQEVYMHDPWRYRSTMTMGLNPFLSGDTQSKFIPVLIYRKQVLTIDGDTWVDCFFHVALHQNKNGGRLIACHENPSDQGRKDVFIDTYRDWLNCAYGMSMIEKSIPDWQKKNVASALGLNAALIEIFPPLAAIAGLLANDREIDVTPGGYNVINFKPQIGLGFCAPIPIAQNGAERSMVYERYLGSKMTAQGGAYGAIMNDPTKTLQSGRTATEVNTETTSGIAGRDNLLEKLSANLEDICQAMYDACRQYEESDVIEYVSSLDPENPQIQQLTKQQLDQDRRMVVTGWKGLQNKQQELAEVREMFQAFTTGNATQLLPSGVLMLQEIIMKYLGLLGFKNLGQYRTDPMQLLLQSPQVQAGLNQMMMQLSQMLQANRVPPQIGDNMLNMIAQVLGVVPQQPGQQPGGPPAPGQPGSGQAPPAKPPGQPPQRQIVAPKVGQAHGGHDLG